jgi:hypothetical protein
MGRVQGTIHSDSGFYIGDLWFGLDVNLYHKFWGDVCHYEDGVFQDPASDWSFAVANTGDNDDRAYTGSDGFLYFVYSSNLALVPLELANKMFVEESEETDMFGRIIYDPGDAMFEAENFVFTYTLPDGSRIVIPTVEQRWEDVP